MSVSFNVLKDPWIPVIWINGNCEVLGIREVFQHAHELQEISIVNPIEEFSVYRFLSILLMDALRPMNKKDLSEIADMGCFAEDLLEEYYNLCIDSGVSFDIFDRKHPFLQPSYNELWDKNPCSVTRMDFAFPSGNNHTHFERRDPNAISYTYSEAFCKMLACHVFMTMSGAGYGQGINGNPPYYCLIAGHNLFETLCAMMVPLGDYFPNVSPRPAIGTIMKDVVPKKERGIIDEDTGEVDTVCFFQAMLFPVRRIILIPDKDKPTVSRIYYGRGFMYRGEDRWTDPSVSYYWREKKDQRIRYAFKPDIDVSAWRNYAEMLREEGRPAVLERYMETNPNWTTATVTLYGMQTDQAKCCNLLRCDLEIPRVVLANAGKIAFLKECLQYGENLSRRLDYALRVAVQGEKPSGNAKEAKKANAYVKSNVYAFLSSCEPLFLDLIKKVCATKEEEYEETLVQWKKDVFRIAKNVFNSAAGNIHASGRILRQIAAGQRILYVTNWQSINKEA